jgi:hypothetical protein
MWFESEPISLISLIRGHVHNDDGSIWDIYHVEKQVFWDVIVLMWVLFHPRHCVVYKYQYFPNGIFYHCTNCRF